MITSIVLLLAASMPLQGTAFPTSENSDADISKRQAGPIDVLPEILMVAVVDGGGPAVDAFGLGAQIAHDLFGELDPGEPYVRIFSGQ